MFQSSFLQIRPRGARTVEVAPAVSIRALLDAALTSSFCIECQPPSWSVAEYRFRHSLRMSLLRDASHVKHALLKRLYGLMDGAQDLARLASGPAAELWPKVVSAGQDAVESFANYLYLANELSSNGSLNQRLGRVASQLSWRVETLISVLSPVTGQCLCRSCGLERAQYSTLYFAPEQKASRFALRCSHCGHEENGLSYVRDADWQHPFLRCSCNKCRAAQHRVRDYVLSQGRRLLPQMASTAQREFARVAATARFDDLPRMQDARGQPFVDQFLCELRQSRSVADAVWQVSKRYLDCHGRPAPVGVVRALVADKVLRPSYIPASYDVGVVDIEEAWDSGLTGPQKLTFAGFQELLRSEHASIALRAMRQDIPKLSLKGVNIVSRYAPSFTLDRKFGTILGEPATSDVRIALAE